MRFQLKTNYQATGDQPQAITALSKGIAKQKRHQTLLGVTGSGKTFTAANVIAKTQKPTLVIAHNKTLAAQLYQEFRDFFPENAVSYFVSYYDYYQPEAYIPSTDTYIEKEATINDEIDKLRLATTTNLMTRPDVIVVASVSCIYNLGSPVEYGQYFVELIEGQLLDRNTLIEALTTLQYSRETSELKRGSFRLRGDRLQVWPAYEDRALSIDTLENQITQIDWIDPISGKKQESSWKGSARERFMIFPAKHYLVNPETQVNALKDIENDLNIRLKELEESGKQLEAYRLKQKVTYDLEMIREFGFVNGIENYSRYFDGRNLGEAPFSLLDHFAENARKFGDGDFLTVVDESHITLPQIRGMYFGDQSRKETLIDYGFRLPSAKDNRPLKFEEFMARTKLNIYVSATPNDFEISLSNNEVVEQLIRPTGLLDPKVEIRKSEGQIENLILEIIDRKVLGERVLVTTLTKRMAEALTEYLNDENKLTKLAGDVLPPELPKVAYLHSDIETLERSDILDDLRRANYDVLVGINLLREGLDLPEVSLVAILDADKEGFLRSDTALIQTMGRAARHTNGHTILYADKITGSMQRAIDETKRRRDIQEKYNQKHTITPSSIQKPIRERLLKKKKEENIKKSEENLYVSLSKKERIDLMQINPEALTPDEKSKLKRKLERRMKSAANEMDFELAAILRDKLSALE